MFLPKVVPAKKLLFFSGQKLRCFQRSYMGDPMSMRDFEDDEITTSNWDLVGDDPMPQLDIWKKTDRYDSKRWIFSSNLEPWGVTFLRGLNFRMWRKRRHLRPGLSEKEYITVSSLKVGPDFLRLRSWTLWPCKAPVTFWNFRYTMTLIPAYYPWQESDRADTKKNPWLLIHMVRLPDFITHMKIP